MRTRRTFTAEFKREAVALAKERGNLASTARELGISGTSLENWKRELEQSPSNAFPGNGNLRDKDHAFILREIKRLEEENAILKKAIGIFTVREQ